MNITKDGEPCRICGKPVDMHYGEPFNDKLGILGICFHCNFWIDKVENRNGHGVVIVDGRHYHLGKDDPKEPSKYKGFSGEKYVVEFFAPANWLQPKVVTTTDLWSQGEIPEEWRPFLPDNARFLRDGK